jgi:MFS family permease
MKLCFTIPGFKTFVVIQSFYGVAFFGIPSLSLIYLREKVGINPGLILYFSTAGIVGAAFASTVWGRWIDRRQSAISLQLIAFLGLSLNSIFWLLLQVVPSGFEYFLAALIMLLNAAWIGALNMSQTHTIMTLAPEDGRVLFQNIATFLTYCSQALAPMLWGLFLDFFDQRKLKLDLGFYQLGTYQIFFAATLLIGLAGAVYIYRVVRKIPVE